MSTAAIKTMKLEGIKLAGYHAIDNNSGFFTGIDLL